MSMSEVHDYFYFNQIRERYPDKGVTITLTVSAKDYCYPDTAWFVAVMPDGGGAPIFSQWLYYPNGMDISEVWDEVKSLGDDVLASVDGVNEEAIDAKE